MRNFLLLLIISPLYIFSQSNGIVFTQSPAWQDILQKAKLENKYIFVDCFATWCGPCKVMDKKVYPDEVVGKFMNANFISVRIQMDTTKADPSEVQNWYATAHALIDQYHIYAYPTYLFFSPDGKAIHKDLGGKESNRFLEMAQAAMDPKRQYYSLLNNYRQGKIDLTLMPVLANEAIHLGQDSLSRKVARDYLHSYLEPLSEQQLLTRENIDFLHRYTSILNYNEKVFRLYYNNRRKVDSIMNNPQFADNDINNVIYAFEVRPVVENAINASTDPNWRRMKRQLAKKYDEVYVVKNVLRGRTEYYKARKEWAMYIRYFIQKEELSGVESWEPSKLNSAFLNNDAFEVFQYSNNKQELLKGLSWVDKAISMVKNPDPEAMDTKANLLYKLGRKTEAIALEQQSYALAHGDKEIYANYEKMKSGLPTWPAN